MLQNSRTLIQQEKQNYLWTGNPKLCPKATHYLFQCRNPARSICHMYLDLVEKIPTSIQKGFNSTEEQ